MTTTMTSNQCSICQKSGGLCICAGCQTFFCIKHFNEHRQQLLIQFDSDVVKSHDELLEQIHQKTEPNNSADDLFSQIDRWEKTTIEKVRKTAEDLRHELTELINSDRDMLTKQFESLTLEIRRRREEEDFAEDIVKNLQQRINQLKQSFEQLTQPNENKLIVVENNEIDWNRIIFAQKQAQKQRQLASFHVPPNAKWAPNGLTVVGGHGQGNAVNQLFNPLGLYVDDDQTIVIADQYNHRIVKWKCDETSGQVIAGGNGKGNRNDQLNAPSTVIIDKQTDSLIICDLENRRVVRWPSRGDTSGETIISNVRSYGLAMDDDGFLYVSDEEKHEVRRWQIGESQGTLVAGGNGCGNSFDQLNCPESIFVDRDQSVYVSDGNNHRVMKWMKDAKEGIVVAGGQGQGNALTQLSSPRGVIIDHLGTIYVADFSNHRIMRWPQEATHGSVVVGGNGQGEQANQLKYPYGLSFDRHGNLYVADNNNHRVQRFSIRVK